MRRTHSAAFALLISGMLVAAPLTATTVFAEEVDSSTAAAEAASVSEPAPEAAPAAEAEPIAEAAPAEEAAPSEPTPAEQAPAVTAPVEEAPSDETPSDEAPAEDAAPVGSEEITTDGDLASVPAPVEASAPLAPAAEYQGRPGVPSGATVKGSQLPSGQWALSIQWNASDPITADTTYRIYWTDHRNTVMPANLTSTRYDFTTAQPVPPGSHYDLYVYAKNSYGEVSTPFYVVSYSQIQPIVVTAPGVPTGLAVSRSNTANSSTLSWSAPASNGNSPITGYTVTAGDGTTTQTATVAAGVTSHEFSGLDVGVVYTYTVAAKNAQFTGTAATTSENFAAVSPSAPRDIVSESYTPRTASVEWVAPAYDGGAPITGYRVEVGDDDVVETDDASTALDLAFEESIIDASIDIRISASNDGGDTWGPAVSGAVVFDAFAPDAPIVTGEARNFHDSSVLVGWTVPSANGSPITGYDVYLFVGNVPVSRRSVAADQTSVLIAGLTPQTQYAAVVIATNEIGDSEPSDFATITTLPAAPGALPESSVGESGAIFVVIVGDTVSATLPGTPVGSWVYAYAYSTPRGLGWAQVGANGVATWSLAGTPLPAGNHHLVVIDESGATVGSTAFVIAAAPAAIAPAVPAAATPAVLASTGAESSTAVAIALDLLALGGMLTVVRRRLSATAARA